MPHTFYPIRQAYDHDDVTFGSNSGAAEFGEVLICTARRVNSIDVVGDETRLDGTVIIDRNNSDVPAYFVFPRSLTGHLR
ncbi:MAG: hypothetical protein AAFU85_18110 [Planctomycetota bacterium]